jgi:Tfp pilus assembly protein PilV
MRVLRFCRRMVVRYREMQHLRTAGLSLIETVVAAAIIAIAALTMIVAFTTMGNVNLRSEQLNSQTQNLEYDISNGVESTYSERGALEFTLEDGTKYSIEGEYTTYTDEDSSFMLFEEPSP